MSQSDPTPDSDSESASEAKSDAPASIDDLINNYDALNVDEVSDRLRGGDFSAADLDRIAAYESDHDDRKTVDNAVERERAALSDADADTDADAGAHTDGSAAMTAQADSDAAPNPVSEPESRAERESESETESEYLNVRVTESLFAGHWFDSPPETVRVQDTPRVREALEAGRGKIVDRASPAPRPGDL